MSKQTYGDADLGAPSGALGRGDADLGAPSGALGRGDADLGAPSGALGRGETTIRPLRRGMLLRYLSPGEHISTNNIPVMMFLSDSWCYPERMVTEYHRGTQQVIIDPHSVAVAVNTPEGVGVGAYGYIGFTWFRVMSGPGLTYREALANKDFIIQWANDVPRVTVLHLGACFLTKAHRHPDIIAGTKTIQDIYRDEIVHFFTTWIEKARGACDNGASRREFEVRLKCHRWLLVAIPDWGDQRIRGISNKEYKTMRTSVNHAMKRFQNILWSKYNAVQCRPRVNRPVFIGNTVHLSKESQKEFATQVIFIS